MMIAPHLFETLCVTNDTIAPTKHYITVHLFAEWDGQKAGPSHFFIFSFRGEKSRCGQRTRSPRRPAIGRGNTVAFRM